MNGDYLKTAESAELRRLLDRLQRNERDLRRRLATRVAALGDPGSPISDPLYQRLFFALRSVEAQRGGAESELDRRFASLVN